MMEEDLCGQVFSFLSSAISVRFEFFLLSMNLLRETQEIFYFVPIFCTVKEDIYGKQTKKIKVNQYQTKTLLVSCVAAN